MDRLSSRFSIGNRLARLSTNWGLPDALARLGLADPSAPLHPGPHPSPIAEEGGPVQQSDQAAMEHQADVDELQLQQQQAPGGSEAWEPTHSAVGGNILQRQSTQQHRQLAACSEAGAFSQPALGMAHGTSDVSGSGADDMSPTRQSPAGQTDPAAPASAPSPAGRAAFASLGNMQSSPLQSELQLLALATVGTHTRSA